jgi:hypothetical protein
VRPGEVAERLPWHGCMTAACWVEVAARARLRVPSHPGQESSGSLNAVMAPLITALQLDRVAAKRALYRNRRPTAVVRDVSIRLALRAKLESKGHECLSRP